MSFDALIMPAAPPQPPAGGVKNAPGKEPAALELDRSARSADQKKSFLTTLNRVSERQTCSHDRSCAGETQTAKPARPDTESTNPANKGKVVNQNAIQDQPAYSEVSEFVPETPLVCEQPAMDLIHEYLMKMSLINAGAHVVEGQSDPASGSANAILPQLIGHRLSEGQNMLAGLVGIGPFEQLQSDISPEADNLSFFKLLVNRALVHELAAEPFGPQADNPFEFWRSLTPPTAEDASLGGWAEGSTSRIDELINFLLNRYTNTSATQGLEAATSEVSGQKAGLNMAANNGNENLALDKMISASQPAEAQSSEVSGQKAGLNMAANNGNENLALDKMISASQPAEAQSSEVSGQKAGLNMAVNNGNENLALDKMISASQQAEAQPSEITRPASVEKDGRMSAGAPKDLTAETLLETRRPESNENSQASKPQPVPKAADPAVNPNLAPEGASAKPSENAIGLKNAILQNEMQPADPSGSKVFQIDGEAKDSSFLASQENLPEHLTKLEHAGRSAEGAQRSLASQTMNQIVQKAVLLNNNGQNAVQIDLKPDFLGHIRMQIVTESHQVAVRIVAEFPFVKDMLESNLNQLKAELQAQGLEVDELEVSVAHDSRADDEQYQKAAEARRARALKNSRLSGDATAEEQTDGHTGSGTGAAENAIDYFA